MESPPWGQVFPTAMAPRCPAHPVSLSFAGVQRHTKADGAELQAGLGPFASLRQELGVRRACQEQQQLCPIFSGSSQVISKLVLRHHGQGPETAPKLVKTLAGFPARRNHQISHRSDSQGPFEYINHMLALGRVRCATCPENHTRASMTRTTEGNKGSESSGKSPDGTSTRDCCCSPSW